MIWIWVFLGLTIYGLLKPVPWLFVLSFLVFLFLASDAAMYG